MAPGRLGTAIWEKRNIADAVPVWNADTSRSTSGYSAVSSVRMA